jgi:hypothetical protein
MPTENPVRLPWPKRQGSSYEPLRYHSRFPDLTPVPAPENEPRLGPYETQYLIELGYAAPPRNVG